jgi:hypothetical protein
VIGVFGFVVVCESDGRILVTVGACCPQAAASAAMITTEIILIFT